MFHDDDLAQRLAAMSPDQLNALPFGVIKLDAANRVLFFSATEARLSGYGTAPILGLDFFADVAPCMDTDEFRGRVNRQRAAGEVDIEIGHTGDFSDPNRFMRSRVMSAAGGGLWLANERA
jgi:photoactive yellow protein